MLRVTDGTYRDKHNRRYVHLNPNRYQGPWTWRLSNLQSYIEAPIEDQLNIFTVLPIDDTRSADGLNINLFFNILGLPDVSAARGRTKKSNSRTFVTSYGTSNALRNITEIIPVEPIKTTNVGTDVGIYFDILDLQPLTTRKQKFNVKGFNYNSKSIDNLTADRPLNVTPADPNSAIVSFDIRQLGPA